MIDEAYVSYEMAELLREKGFNVKCRSYFWGEEKTSCRSYLQNWNDSSLFLSRPIHQMALAWLRSKGIIISVRVTNFPYEEGNLHYVADILGADEKWKDNDICFDTYEEAIEAALKYSLENLI